MQTSRIALISCLLQAKYNNKKKTYLSLTQQTFAKSQILIQFFFQICHCSNSENSQSIQPLNPYWKLLQISCCYKIMVILRYETNDPKPDSHINLNDPTLYYQWNLVYMGNRKSNFPCQQFCWYQNDKSNKLWRRIIGYLSTRTLRSALTNLSKRSCMFFAKKPINYFNTFPPKSANIKKKENDESFEIMPLKSPRIDNAKLSESTF